MYEGALFCSCKEGYGLTSHGDGCTFEVSENKPHILLNNIRFNIFSFPSLTLKNCLKSNQRFSMTSKHASHFF